MIRRRQVIKALMAAPVAMITTGCVTRSLFEDNHYSEDVKSVLISQDGKKLVFIGENYHYIFDAPDVIVKTLNGTFEKYAEADFKTFYIDEEANISGECSIRLSTRDGLSDEVIAAAKTAGYEVDFWDRQMRYKGEIKGIRYESGGMKLPKLNQKELNRPYTVYVTAKLNSREKAVKSLLTPITLAVDGALFIGSTPLLLLGPAGFYVFGWMHCETLGGTCRFSP